MFNYCIHSYNSGSSYIFVNITIITNTNLILHIFVTNRYQSIFESKSIALSIIIVINRNYTKVHHFWTKYTFLIIDNLRISHNASGMEANIRVLVT